MSQEESFSKFNLLWRLWDHIGIRRQRQFMALMALTLISTFAEIMSIGAVLPFLSILIAPEKIFNYSSVQYFANVLNIPSAEQMVLPLTVIFIVISLLSGGIRLSLLWASTKFAFAIGADLSAEVYRKTLYQSFEIHISRNSSEVVSGIINKVNGVVFFVILPALTLISSVILLIAITCTLLLINPFIASVALLGFGISYGFISILSRHRLQQNGKCITREQTQVIKALQEGLGGIRDVLLDGTQNTYCEIYKKADRPLRRAYGDNIFIGGAPRFIMEALGMALIALLAYALSRTSDGVFAALPLLGALALGAQRILPAMQQSYSAWASITGGYSTLKETVELLDQPLPQEINSPKILPLPLKESVSFCNVKYRYTSEGPFVLKGINFSVVKGARVGIIGSSGSGKSTVVDLLMGLLTPTEGIILIDGEPFVGNRVKAWQKTIAHVPQSIYLADTTLAENIAFGVTADMIDIERVQLAAQKAQIADFIESSPGSYFANVGERGIRLSGGQRQRIGIARALYKNAEILIFDEATSALDQSTELSVMNAIDNLDRNLTIIIVAHRLSTLRKCDTIVELENGYLKNISNFSNI